MAKIRSLKDFQISIGGRIFTNEPWESDWFTGIIISIDDKSISSTAKTRRICACGHIDDQDDESCPSCGNKTWYRTRLGRWRWGNDGGSANRIPRIVDDNIIGLNVKVSYDSKRSMFIMQEITYDVLENKDGFYNLQDHTIDAKALNSIFDTYIADKPEWDNMRKLLQMYPASTIQEWMSWVPESTKDVKVALYNIDKAIPGISLVSRELFQAIFVSILKQSFKQYKGVNDYFKSVNAPIALSELYPILGLPQHCNLSVLDSCNQDFINVVIHALIHNRISYNELEPIVRNHSAEEINGYGAEWVDFFRRNVVKHGAKTFDAFLAVYNIGKPNLKEANLARLDAYCKKKGVKTFPDAYDAIMNGDGLGFLAALAGETK